MGGGSVIDCCKIVSAQAKLDTDIWDYEYSDYKQPTAFIPMGAVVTAFGTGGKLFSIRTEEKFPGQYEPLADRAKEQQNNGELTPLTTHIENLDDCDVIFIDYPVWWYTLPQVMFSFFDEYDFARKTVVPFVTHYGSRDGGTFRTIAELEPDATVLQGIAVHQNDVANCREDVLEWLGGLGW